MEGDVKKAGVDPLKSLFFQGLSDPLKSQRLRSLTSIRQPSEPEVCFDLSCVLTP